MSSGTDVTKESILLDTIIELTNERDSAIQRVEKLEAILNDTEIPLICLHTGCTLIEAIKKYQGRQP